jgi:hypothetical protein
MQSELCTIEAFPDNDQACDMAKECLAEAATCCLCNESRVESLHYSRSDLMIDSKLCSDPQSQEVFVTRTLLGGKTGLHVKGSHQTKHCCPTSHAGCGGSPWCWQPISLWPYQWKCKWYLTSVSMLSKTARGNLTASLIMLCVTLWRKLITESPHQLGWCFEILQTMLRSQLLSLTWWWQQ